MIATEILARLKQTCVLFQGIDGSIGSGYIIARGHIATAAHVVKPRAIGETFSVSVGWPPLRRQRQATLLRRDEVADAAVLSVEGCDDIEALPVGWAGPDDVWRSFGFPVAMSLDREKVNGVHMSGKIIDMQYAAIDGTPQIALHNDEAITRMDMRGASGAPLTVGGAIVGHLAQQYRDRDNLSQSVSGQLKACPVKAVLDLLPPGVNVRKPAPAAQSTLTQPDVDMADLVAWCDRIEVTSTLEDWLEKGAGSAGLMCLIGHADQRYDKLLSRIATQLSERKVNKVLANACHMRDAVALGRPPQFRRGVEAALDTPFERIEKSLKFRGGAGLVLLSHCCDWPVGPVKEMENHLLHLAEWLAGLKLGKRRLVLVLSLRYEDGDVHDKAAATVKKAVTALRRKHAVLGNTLLDDPIVLGDYGTGHVRNWIRLPLITMNLGRKVDRLEGVLDEHYAKTTWNPRKLHQFVEKSLKGINDGHG